MDLLGPEHLIAWGAQDFSSGAVLRIGIEAAAAEKHEFDEEADGAAIGESVGLSADDSRTDRHTQLCVADHFADRGCELLAVRYHLVFESFEGVLFERLHLLRLND
jgi:hypothetical protein